MSVHTTDEIEHRLDLDHDSRREFSDRGWSDRKSLEDIINDYESRITALEARISELEQRS